MITMAATFRNILFLACWCISNLIPASHAGSGAYYMPITYKIPRKQTECIYDKFDKSDFVTFSVFVVEAMSNGPPKAEISFEGPIHGNEDVLKKVEDALPGTDFAPKSSLGQDLRNGAQMHWPVVKDADKKVRYDKRLGIINREIKVDWSHAGESEDAEAARAQIEMEKKEAYRSYGRKAEPGSELEMEQKKDKVRTITQVNIEPFEETTAIKASGWYRVCVSAEAHALLVEMELRSGNKLGGVDRKTGHVYTHEEREMLDEEKSIEDGITASEESLIDANTYASKDEEVQKELENQVKEQDMHATKAQIKHLNSMVMEIKKNHQDKNMRLKAYSYVARTNHYNMVWSSKLETVLYMIITGVQVYTVRKWLLNSSVLGS